MNSRIVLKGAKEYSIIALGILLYVVGWSVFLVPNNLIGGGVTGIASIIQYATNGAIKVGTSYFAINTVLIILAFIILGSGSGGKNIFAMTIAAIGLNVFQTLIPSEFVQDLAVGNGKLMSTIMGGVMVGGGIGVAMSQGGSTGGTDIIALIVNKYRNITPGRMILMMDFVIILSSLAFPSYTQDGELMPFAEKVATVVYGYILILVVSTTLDLYLAGTKQSVQLFILSRKSDQIADMITNELRRGVTVLNGIGWYTKQESKVLMVLTRKTDLNIMLKMIKSIDSEAFLSVSSVTGVYGKGFETFKIRRKE